MSGVWFRQHSGAWVVSGHLRSIDPHASDAWGSEVGPLTIVHSESQSVRPVGAMVSHCGAQMAWTSLGPRSRVLQLFGAAEDVKEWMGWARIARNSSTSVVIQNPSPVQAKSPCHAIDGGHVR